MLVGESETSPSWSVTSMVSFDCNKNLEIGYGRGFWDVNENTLTRSLFFPNTLETPSVANCRVFKEMISFHSVLGSAGQLPGQTPVATHRALFRQ